MATKETGKSLTNFLAAATITFIVAYSLSFVSIWVYDMYIKQIKLPLGESILLLGGMVTVLYCVTGYAIAYWYAKYMR